MSSQSQVLLGRCPHFSPPPDVGSGELFFSYLGMVVAMYIGMLALNTGRLLLLPGPAFGGDIEALIMAGEMTVGMGVWMAIRRHPWLSIVVMSAAMDLPFLLLLPFFWVRLLSGDALMTLGHA